jgi:type IX secretion system PorP/SprF family membrane protein
MQKVILTSVVLIMFSVAVHAQLYDSYYYDYKLLNPALAGNLDKHIITTVYSGYPSQDYASMFYGSYETSLPSIKSGMGAIVSNERYGVIGDFRTGLFFSKQIQFNERSGIRLGVQHYYRKTEYNYDRIGPIDFNTDIALPTNYPEEAVNADFGLVYYSLIANIGVGVKSVFKELDRRNSLWSVMVSREFKIENVMKISPSFVWLTDGDYANRFDVNGIIEIKQWILVGGGYQFWDSDDSFTLSAGLNVKDWVQVIGHVYASYNDHLREYNNGRVEVLVRANIPHHKKENKSAE